jgi:hypothetical protein
MDPKQPVAGQTPQRNVKFDDSILLDEEREVEITRLLPIGMHPQRLI